MSIPIIFLYPLTLSGEIDHRIRSWENFLTISRPLDNFCENWARFGTIKWREIQTRVPCAGRFPPSGVWPLAKSNYTYSDDGFKWSSQNSRTVAFSFVQKDDSVIGEGGGCCLKDGTFQVKTPEETGGRRWDQPLLLHLIYKRFWRMGKSYSIVCQIICNFVFEFGIWSWHGGPHLRSFLD